MSSYNLIILGLCVASMWSTTIIAASPSGENQMQNSQDVTASDSHLVLLLENEERILEVEAQRKIQQFGKRLKHALVTAIQEDGLVHAVNVCHTVAPEIAVNLSSDGWTVGRTSLRTRNTDNAADRWEKQTLQYFDSEYKAGRNAKQLTASLNDNVQFRYMKAIPTEQVCLACHGSSIDSELSASIRKQYPNDTAVGFTLEDIRGAFTLSKSLTE